MVRRLREGRSVRAGAACALSAALVAVACGGPPTETSRPAGPGAPPDELRRARAAADALGQDLMGTLLQELRAGGPVSAIRVCSEQAPRIAASRSRDGVRVRRVGTRLRNPANEPDPHERRVLRTWRTAEAGGGRAGESIEVVDEGDGPRLRYLRPIRVGEPCLVCHGAAETLDPAVAAAIDERYPEDRATGYRAGDLRGAISVSVPVRTSGDGAPPAERP